MLTATMPADHQVVAIRRLLDERSLVDVVQEHLRAEVHVGADGRHDRREDAAHGQSQQSGRQIVTEQHAVGELFVDAAVAQARPSHGRAERRQRDEGEHEKQDHLRPDVHLRGFASVARREDALPLHRTRHRRGVAAVSHGRSDRPRDDAEHAEELMVHRRMPADDALTERAHERVVQTNGSSKVRQNGPHQRQRRTDNHERLEEIRDHDADVPGQQNVEQDDGDDDGEGCPEIPAQHRLGDFVHSEQSGAGPGDDRDERAAQRHPRSNRDGRRCR